MAEDDGITWSLEDLCVLDADLLQVALPIFGCTLHVGLMFALGADRRDTDKFKEILEEATFMLADVVLDLAHNGV